MKMSLGIIGRRTPLWPPWIEFASLVAETGYTRDWIGDSKHVCFEVFRSMKRASDFERAPCQSAPHALFLLLRCPACPLSCSSHFQPRPIPPPPLLCSLLQIYKCSLQTDICLLCTVDPLSSIFCPLFLRPTLANINPRRLQQHQPCPVSRIRLLENVFAPLIKRTKQIALIGGTDREQTRCLGHQLPRQGPLHHWTRRVQPLARAAAQTRHSMPKATRNMETGSCRLARLAICAQPTISWTTRSHPRPPRLR